MDGDTKLNDEQKFALRFLNYNDRKTIEQGRKALLRVRKGRSVILTERGSQICVTFTHGGGSALPG